MEDLKDRYQKDFYKTKYSLEERLSESENIINKYDNRAPIIVEYSVDFPSKYRTMEKQKYLVPKDLLFMDFVRVIRKQITMESHKGLYVFAENKYLMRCSESIEYVYNKHKSEDNFLYLTIAVESTFGSESMVANYA